VLLVVLVLALGTGGYAAHLYYSQGLDPDELAEYEPAKITQGLRGIPTIAASSWVEAVEAQGYVVASERLYQMDLMRRMAGGRLSEWFGARALDVDRRRAVEDWDGVATRAYASLPPDQKEMIDAYVRGVNRFISENTRRWGIEYLILRTEPENWEGKDSMLVMLSMIEQLTAFSNNEAVASVWEDHLGAEWFNFLFSLDHPWNDPMFGRKVIDRPVLPAGAKLPMRAIEATEKSPVAFGTKIATDDALGSNNWAWCGKTGCFLANDPHLGANVPHLWYALRMRVAKDDWAVGVSIPGLPGIILGMNPHLAWAFTNVGEDVDDLLLEQLSPDGEQYLASVENGEEVWQKVKKREHVIKIKDGGEEKLYSLHTHRGPLVQRAALGDGWYSRQWLPYLEGTVRLPVKYNLAKSLEEIDAALDEFKAPAQNVLIVDKKKNIMYRASGTGIQRKIGGRRPQRALDGEWAGLEPSSARPRMLFYPKQPNAEEPRYIATANERIWVDEYGHRWAEDLRKDRIRRVLSSRDDFTRADMEKLQLDTESRYHHLLLDWVRARVEAKDAEESAILERWAKWNGVAQEDPATFTEAVAVELGLLRMCLDRVKRELFDGKDRDLAYDHWMKSGWVIAMLEAEKGTEVFGFEERDLARALLEIARLPKKPYHEENRWAAQHPFVGRVPLIGDWFKVATEPQYGWRGVVRVEQPNYGASVRLVWNLDKPEDSTWMLTVGQSGHIRSPYYRDRQEDWFAGRFYPVFDEAW
jgi:penicillin amidase